MNQIRAFWQSVQGDWVTFGVASLLVCILASCAKKEEAAPMPAPEAAPPPIVEAQEKSAESVELSQKRTAQAVQPEAEHPSSTRAPASTSVVPAVISAEDYKVKLGADPLLRIPGPSGELRVWIGVPAYEPTYEDLNVTSDTLPSGTTAIVTPYAPGFIVEPDKSICMRTSPRGSEVRFKLTPKETGNFKVGADVNMFNSDNCSGIPILKASRTLQVNVSVDGVKMITKYSNELWEVFWKKLLEFWGAVVMLFFAALLFLFRKKLKKWFGYTE